jgi:hypothetical protein
MKTKSTTLGLRNSNIVRIFVGTGLILLIPMVAMQFSSEVNWGLEDFVVIGALLIGAGLVYEFVASKVKNSTHRALLALLVVGIGVWLWAELAVGLFTNWGS